MPAAVKSTIEGSLNTREAAAYIGVHYVTLTKMVKRRKIRALRRNGTRSGTMLFVKSDLDTFLSRTENMARR